MAETGLIAWNKRDKKVLRAPGADDFFPEEETDSLSEIIERSFMRRLLASGAEAGMQINELELAREIGVGTTSVREFLIRFSRFGLIEKRPNSHWVLKGFTRSFALELTEIREMFVNGALVALAGGRLVPLVVIVEDDGDGIVEIGDKAVLRSAVDQQMEALVECRELLIAAIHVGEHIEMVLLDDGQMLPGGMVLRQTAEIGSRVQLEHLDYIAALESGDQAQIDFSARLHLRSARQTLLQSLPQNPADV
jgi:DNA-binding GntR family transcriptional regulator